MKSSKAQSKLHASIYLDKTKLLSSTRCTSPFCLAHPSILDRGAGKGLHSNHATHAHTARPCLWFLIRTMTKH
eukprot:scaffold13538_cov72-Cyclotella_meneghiniana.AAC.2